MNNHHTFTINLKPSCCAADGVEIDVTEDQLEQLERDWLAYFYGIKADVEYDGDPFDVDPYSVDDNDPLYYPNIQPFDVPAAQETAYVNQHGIMPGAVAGNEQSESNLLPDEYDLISYESKITFKSSVKLEIVSRFSDPSSQIKWLCDTGCDCGCNGCTHADKNRYVAYGRGSKESLDTAIKQYIQHCKQSKI